MKLNPISMKLQVIYQDHNSSKKFTCHCSSKVKFKFTTIYKHNNIILQQDIYQTPPISSHSSHSTTIQSSHFPYSSKVIMSHWNNFPACSFMTDFEIVVVQNERAQLERESLEQEE